MPRAVLMCGDRNWRDADAIRRAFDREAPDLVIHGGARGADRLAGREAALRSINSEEYAAQWEHYGRAAGLYRNTEMLERLCELEAEGWEIKVVAFHSDLARSRGTRNMVGQARAAEVETEVVA